jgi:hypothetical protein
MSSLIKEIIINFVIIVFANVIVELGDEEKNFLVNPVGFFGAALIVSIIGGYITNLIKNRSKASQIEAEKPVA